MFAIYLIGYNASRVQIYFDCLAAFNRHPFTVQSGSVCVTGGFPDREENCFDFACSPLFQCLVCHVCIVEKGENEPILLLIERISSFCGRDRKPRFCLSLGKQKSY